MTAGAQERRPLPFLGMEVSTRPLGEQRCVIELAGEVDLHTAPAVQRELLGAIENGSRELVVDMTETSFVDSTFLGVVLEARSLLNGSGGSISIVCGDPALLKVFTITGVDALLAIHPTLDDATGRPEPRQ